jgi:hypothetical protein
MNWTDIIGVAAIVISAVFSFAFMFSAFKGYKRKVRYRDINRRLARSLTRADVWKMSKGIEIQKTITLSDGTRWTGRSVKRHDL